jgi:hypothetical protein
VHPVALPVPRAEDSTEACSNNSPNLPKCNSSDRSATFPASVITSDSQMVQENPALIQPLMQQIATSNPQLAQLINQNPQALYDLLGAGAPGEGEGEDDFLGPQVMHVDLTEADAAAVERVRFYLHSSHFHPLYTLHSSSSRTFLSSSHSLSVSLLSQLETGLTNSSRHSGSTDKWFCRPTCSATRTKN